MMGSRNASVLPEPASTATDADANSVSYVT